MPELILSGVLGAALVGIALWVYFSQKEIARRIDTLQAESAERIETLATETREALAEMTLKISGLRDHIAAQNTDIGVMEKSLAEFSKNMDADVIDKLKDRVGLVEMATGVRRIDSTKKLG